MVDLLVLGIQAKVLIMLPPVQNTMIFFVNNWNLDLNIIHLNSSKRFCVVIQILILIFLFREEYIYLGKAK